MQKPSDYLYDFLERNTPDWLRMPRDLEAPRLKFGAAIALVVGLNILAPIESSNAPTAIEYSDTLSASKNGANLEVTSAANHEISENLDGQKHLYGYLKNALSKHPIFPKLSAPNQENVLDALIQIVRDLNPDIDLDHPNSFKGKTLIFPKNLTLEFEAPEGPLNTGGYPYLQDAALLDGMDVRDLTQTDEIYTEALSTGVELDKNATSFYQKEGVTTPNKLAEDVHERFTAIADRFFEETGYKIAYTDILRNKAMIAATPGSIPSSTHPTGRSIDVADGRFKTTDNNEITWSVKDANGKAHRGPDADLIEDLRTKLVGIIKDDDAFIFTEAGHWHLYFPKNEAYSLDLNTILKFGKDIPLEEIQGEAEPQNNENSISSHSRVLDALLAETAPNKVDEKTAKANWEKIYQEWAPAKTPKRPQLTLLTQGSNKHQLQLQTVEWIKSMSSRVLLELEPLKGLTIHKDSSTVPNYSNIQKIWAYKLKNKLHNSEGWSQAIEKLSRGNNPKISFTEYIQAIEDSNKLLKDRQSEFKLPNWAQYLTPEVNIAILQAEFFSEFRGNRENTETFIHLLPSLFENYDLTRGPAINDSRLSGGCIQVIDTTYDDILRKHTKALKAAGHSAPNKANKEAYLKAMIFDFNEQALTNQLIIIDHLSLGMSYLLKDARFKTAWENASSAEKTIFLGTLAPLAINGGRGIPPKAAKIALEANNSTKLSDYTKSIGAIGENDVGDGIGSFAARGANVGYLTMQVLLPNQ